MNPVGSNLSTSQFAALGLWACGRMDSEIDREVWRKHLTSLCSRQVDSGSWTYWPGRGNARGYRTGTYMGLANLILARAALGDTLEDDSELKFRADRALEKALEALERDGVETLRLFRREEPNGWSSHYELYALEKACIFAEREEVGGRKWYAEAAEVLVDSQRDNGGWGALVRSGRAGGPLSAGRTDLYRTAFALLFLLRTSETYRPTTPSGVRGGVTTPGSEKPLAPSTRRGLDEEDTEESDAPASPTPFGTAGGLLDELERQLAQKTTPVVALLDLLDEAAVAYVTLAPGPIPPDADGNAMMAAEEAFLKGERAWKQRAESIFVKALVSRRVDKRNKINRRDPVNVRAARILRRVHERVAPSVRKAIDKYLLDPRGYIVSPELYEEAFATLGHLGEPQSLTWLVEEVVRAERRPESVKRTEAALKAIPLYRDVPGKRRRAAAEHLVTLYTGIESHRHPDDYNAVRMQEYWERIGPSVIDALRALCRDPETGKRPLDQLGFWIGTVKDFDAFLRRHESLSKPPWR
jgi:hypothetical protein